MLLACFPPYCSLGNAKRSQGVKQIFWSFTFFLHFLRFFPIYLPSLSMRLSAFFFVAGTMEGSPSGLVVGERRAKIRNSRSSFAPPNPLPSLSLLPPSTPVWRMGSLLWTRPCAEQGMVLEDRPRSKIPTTVRDERRNEERTERCTECTRHGSAPRPYP